MKKIILWSLTAIAIFGIFTVGACVELTVPAIILAVVCIAWLTLMAVANWRCGK